MPVVELFEEAGIVGDEAHRVAVRFFPDDYELAADHKMGR